MQNMKYWFGTYLVFCFVAIWLIVYSPIVQMQESTFQPTLGPYEAVVIITIDDVAAPDSNINRVITLLDRLEIPATLGVITGRADWRFIKSLSKKGYEIASHSRTHPFSADYDFDTEIGKSKKEIEFHVNVTVFSYICPNGSYSTNIIQTLKKYDYLVFRDVGHKRVAKTTYSNGLFRAEVTAEAGPWGTQNLQELNAKFDEAKTKGRPYSLILHPKHIDIEILEQHLTYIQKMDGIKFMTLASFYLIQDNI